MQYTEVSELIAGIGLPYAYYQFPEGTAQAPPFICFLYPEGNDVHADNVNYQKVEQLVIELYQDSFNPEIEARVEEALTAAGISFDRQRAVIDSEKLFETIYTMEVLVNG